MPSESLGSASPAAEMLPCFRRGRLKEGHFVLARLIDPDAMGSPGVPAVDEFKKAIMEAKKQQADTK